MQSMCRAAGIFPERISAVKRAPGWEGCGYSHVKCALTAKERNLPWVLVLEDDCEFTQQDFKRFAALLPYLWENRSRWEYFNGGLTFVKNPEIYDARIPLIRANGYTTHFILYTAAAYDKIAAWTPAAGPCDVYFDMNMKSLTTYPLIAHQLTGKSDINNTDTNYTEIFETSNNTLKEFLRSNGLLHLG